MMALRSKLAQLLQRLHRDEQGQDLIEYALLLGFMVIAIYVVLPGDIIPAVSFVYSRIISCLIVFGGA